MVEKGLISVAITTVAVIVGKQVVEKVPCNRNANKNEEKDENVEKLKRIRGTTRNKIEIWCQVVMDISEMAKKDQKKTLRDK